MLRLLRRFRTRSSTNLRFQPLPAFRPPPKRHSSANC